MFFPSSFYENGSMDNNENNYSHFNKILGLYIRHRREDLGLTREYLAQESGMSNNGIAKIENGEVKGEARIYFSSLMQLCRPLGIEANELQNLYYEYLDRKEED